MTSKIGAYLGFGIKSGNVIFGYDALVETTKRVKLVVVCKTVNQKVEQKLLRLCESKKWIMAKTNVILGDLIHRDNCKVMAILDKSLANAIVDTSEVNILYKGL